MATLKSSPDGSNLALWGGRFLAGNGIIGDCDVKELVMLPGN